MKTYNELYHHGILGMRWGKRNGPPYPLSGAAKTLMRKRANKGSAALKKARRTNVNDLSDNDLIKTNNRLRNEQEFKRLTNNGNKKTKELLFDVGTVAVSGGLLAASVKTGNTYAQGIAKTTLAAASLNTIRDVVSKETYDYAKNTYNKVRKNE